MRSQLKGGAQLITPMCASFESFASPLKNAISLLLQTLASKCTERVFKHYSTKATRSNGGSLPSEQESGHVCHS